MRYVSGDEPTTQGAQPPWITKKEKNLPRRRDRRFFHLFLACCKRTEAAPLLRRDRAHAAEAAGEEAAGEEDREPGDEGEVPRHELDPRVQVHPEVAGDGRARPDREARLRRAWQRPQLSICALEAGAEVGVSPAMGSGFDVSKVGSGRAARCRPHVLTRENVVHQSHVYMTTDARLFSAARTTRPALSSRPRRRRSLSARGTSSRTNCR